LSYNLISNTELMGCLFEKSIASAILSNSLNDTADEPLI
jgi:hypothetical protein